MCQAGVSTGLRPYTAAAKLAPKEKIMIYGGLLISLLGIALIFLVWLLGFGLPLNLAGFLLGSALIYAGWVLTERGPGRSR
jgi:hypothetical protein